MPKPVILDKTGEPIARNEPSPALPAVVKDEPKSFLSILSRVASDPTINAEKARAFLDMQKEIRAEEARMIFTKAMVAMQAELPTINADGKIVIEPKPGARSQRTQVTKYATFQNIHSVVMPILRKHGFALWFEPAEAPSGGVCMRGHLDHVEGHSVKGEMTLPLETGGSKNNVQGAGSSISYAKRYITISLLNIISYAKDDADLDGNKDRGPKTLSDDQVNQIIEQCAQAQVSKEGLLGFVNKKLPEGAPAIERLEDIPASRFKEIMTALENRGKENARSAQR